MPKRNHFCAHSFQCIILLYQSFLKPAEHIHSLAPALQHCIISFTLTIKYINESWFACLVHQCCVKSFLYVPWCNINHTQHNLLIVMMVRVCYRVGMFWGGLVGQVTRCFYTNSGTLTFLRLTFCVKNRMHEIHHWDGGRRILKRASVCLFECSLARSWLVGWSSSGMRTWLQRDQS